MLFFVAINELMQISRFFTNVCTDNSMASLTSEQIQANTLMETDINNAVKENMATFIAKGVTDDSWNAFVSMFDGMKVAEYMSVYQSAIDTMELD